MASPGRHCTICNNLKAAQIDAALAAGVSVSEVAASFSISESAAYRHRSRHLSASLLREARAAAGTGATDLVERLAEALDDVSAVRSAALLSGSSAQVLRAASSTARLVEVLLDRLGIDSTETARLLHEGESLARAVGRVVAARPEIAQPIADELRSRGETEAAAALEGLATRARITEEVRG